MFKSFVYEFGAISCKPCYTPWVFIEPGTGPHAARVSCAKCRRWLSWLSKKGLAKLLAEQVTNPVTSDELHKELPLSSFEEN